MITVWLVLVASPFARAEEKRVLVLAGPEFPTGWMYEPDGSVGGARPEFFNVLAERAGLRWTGRLLPAKRLMFALLDGHVDLSMLVRNPLLDDPERILTSKDPLYTENLNIYTREDTPRPEYRSDLEGQRVVVMRGYGYGGFKTWLDAPENRVHQVEVDSFPQAISVLVHAQADYALLYDFNFEAGMHGLSAMGREEQWQQGLGLTATRWSKVPVYFHLSRKGLPDAEEVLARLMQSFHELREQELLPPVEAMDMPGDRPE